MIEVHWDLLTENEGRIAGNQTTLLGPWADCRGNGESAAQAIIEDYWLHDPEMWEEWFGDDQDADLLLLVSGPESIAGRYKIEAKKVIKVRAVLTPLPAPKAGIAIFGHQTTDRGRGGNRPRER